MIELDDDDDEDGDGIVVVVETPVATKKKNNAVNNTLTTMGANSTRPIGNKQEKAMLKEEKNKKIHSSASGMVNAHNHIADSMEVAADCKHMEQLRENIKFYCHQIGMTAKVPSLMAKLDKLSEKTNEDDNDDNEGVVPETVEANETRRTSSPGTKSLLAMWLWY
jgi:hypothetical protein